MSGYPIYGWELPCLICGEENTAAHFVHASEDTKRLAWSLVDVVAEAIARAVAAAGPGGGGMGGRTGTEPRANAMIGVLFTPTHQYVAVSGRPGGMTHVRDAVVRANRRVTFILSEYAPVPERSIGGHDVRRFFERIGADRNQAAIPEKYQAVLDPHYRHTRVTSASKADPKKGTPPPIGVFERVLGGGPGCVCAAPKLLSPFTHRHSPLIRPDDSLEMVEVWAGETGKRVYGEVQTSCEFCRWILPTLLCRSASGRYAGG